jgi:membrane associated rhomboid family serine protease
MIPISTTAPARNKSAPTTYGVVLICTLTFLWQRTLEDWATVNFLATYALIPRRYDDPAWAYSVGLSPSDYTPLLTSTFLHGDWLHLIFNMWTLWLFGRAVESRMGSGRFVLLYVFCALFAGYAHMMVYPNSISPVIGASGAIAGVVGAHATLYPSARILLLIPILFIPLIIPISAFWYLGLWFGFQVWHGTTAIAGSVGGGVAWWAHIGGMLAGLVFVRALTPPPSRGGA